MELQEKDAEVASCFNDLLDKWTLPLEIQLHLKEVFGTTIDWVNWTFISALHQEAINPKATFLEDLLHPFGWLGNSGWATGKIISCMTFWPFHVNHPSFIWACFPPGCKFIHEARRGICWICRMALWVVDHEHGPISRPMDILKYGNNFLL